MSQKYTKFAYCHVKEKVVPYGQHVSKHASERQLASVAHGYIQDEMAPTRHPVTGEIFTSKSKFRATTKAHGYEEVGTAYENGHDPSKKLQDRWNQTEKRLSETFREVLNNGYNRDRRG